MEAMAKGSYEPSATNYSRRARYQEFDPQWRTIIHDGDCTSCGPVEDVSRFERRSRQRDNCEASCHGYSPNHHVRSEPFSSCVAVHFDAVEHEDGLHDRGRSTGAAAQLGQDFKVLSVAMARSPQARIFACARLTAFCRRDSFGRRLCRLNGVRTLPRAP